MKIGDTVRHSGYTIQQARDYWLNCGREPYKSRARDRLDALLAERGTVIEVGKTTAGCNFVKVRTTDGATHSSLLHLWEVVR